MKLHCPHCGVKGSADDSYRGRKVKCPKCQGIFEVTRDASVELSPEAALLSAAAAISAKSSPPLREDAPPVTPDAGRNKNETIESLSGTESEELFDFADDPAEPEPATPSPAQELTGEEESIDWDDLASEIDQQLTEEEVAAEPEKNPEGSPVDMSSVEDEFEQPVAGETVAPEVAAVGGNSVEEATADEIELVEEKDKIEQEPDGVEKKLCWQCAKSESGGETFITRDGRLYCADCAPAEDAVATADIRCAQKTDTPDSTADAARGNDTQPSFGAAIKKVWTKIKGALFS